MWAPSWNRDRLSARHPYFSQQALKGGPICDGPKRGHAHLAATQPQNGPKVETTRAVRDVRACRYSCHPLVATERCILNCGGADYGGCRLTCGGAANQVVARTVVVHEDKQRAVTEDRSPHQFRDENWEKLSLRDYLRIIGVRPCTCYARRNNDAPEDRWAVGQEQHRSYANPSPMLGSRFASAVGEQPDRRTPRRENRTGAACA